MTPAERVVGMAVALIGCAATVIMVPEVRCAVGLDSALDCLGTAGVTSLMPPAAATLRAAPPEDRRLDPIRKRYNWIESKPAAVQRFEPVALDWSGADSASVIVHADPAGVAKVTARVYNGNQRNVLKFYYADSSLVFVHQVLQSMHLERNEYQQRFYFDQGQMFRWLAPDGMAVSDGTPDFRANSRQLAAIGQHLFTVASRMPRTGG